MIEQLFGSKTRVKLLKLFMSNPNRSFYVREITRKIDEQINSVRRELSNLLSIGIISSSSDSSNNRLYYEVDQKFEHYEALASMFSDLPVKKAAKSAVKEGKSKSDGESNKPSSSKKTSASKEEQALGNVELLVLGGAFTRNKKSPVDVLIVGDVTPSALENYISGLESTAGSEISFATFTSEEFAYRQQIKDKFIVTMLEGKLTVKVDKNDVIAQTNR